MKQSILTLTITLVCALGFVTVATSTMATTKQVQTIYVSMHGGGR